MITKDFKRDMTSKALINKNETAFDQYKKLKQKDQRLANVERELKEIKELLKGLTNVK